MQFRSRIGNRLFYRLHTLHIESFGSLFHYLRPILHFALGNTKKINLNRNLSFQLRSIGLSLVPALAPFSFFFSLRTTQPYPTLLLVPYDWTPTTNFLSFLFDPSTPIGLSLSTFSTVEAKEQRIHTAILYHISSTRSRQKIILIHHCQSIQSS